MQLTCPDCGEPIDAEKINIQKMVAVCSACNTVFSFDLPESKVKRRKVKKPQHLELHDTDKLHMAFRTNFRLDKDENFVSSAVSSVVFTFVALAMAGGAIASDVPILLPIGFGLLALCLYYWLALIVFNKTHIEMDDEAIRVSRKPVPNLFDHIREVNLSGVVAVRCEETAVSKTEAYDTPRYRVWAEMVDGSQKIIVNDVIDDYSYFIAQRLNERLHADADTDVSRLADVEQSIEDEQVEDNLMQTFGETAAKYQ